MNEAITEREVPMTFKVRAEIAVAHHLGTDLSTERGRRANGEEGALKIQWVGCHGGDHIVTTSDGHIWAVDLVLDEVTARGLSTWTIA